MLLSCSKRFQWGDCSRSLVRHSWTSVWRSRWTDSVGWAVVERLNVYVGWRRAVWELVYRRSSVDAPLPSQTVHLPSRSHPQYDRLPQLPHGVHFAVKAGNVVCREIFAICPQAKATRWRAIANVVSGGPLATPSPPKSTSAADICVDGFVSVTASRVLIAERRCDTWADIHYRHFATLAGRVIKRLWVNFKRYRKLRGRIYFFLFQRGEQHGYKPSGGICLHEYRVSRKKMSPPKHFALGSE